MTFEWKLPKDYFRVWVKTQWKSAKSDPANHICQCAFCVTINLIQTVIVSSGCTVETEYNLPTPGDLLDSQC